MWILVICSACCSCPVPRCWEKPDCEFLCLVQWIRGSSPRSRGTRRGGSRRFAWWQSWASRACGMSRTARTPQVPCQPQRCLQESRPAACAQPAAPPGLLPAGYPWEPALEPASWKLNKFVARIKLPAFYGTASNRALIFYFFFLAYLPIRVSLWYQNAKHLYSFLIWKFGNLMWKDFH